MGSDYADSAERFAKDTAGHKMVILRDDGLYRHLRFTSKPDGGYAEYWFDLVTWPGVLVIRGDMETFAFSRAEDMLAFFRGGRVNPGYWAEKLLAPKQDDVKRYSEDVFRKHVTEEAAECEEDWPGLSVAVEKAFFGGWISAFGEPDRWDPSFEESARQGLGEFRFGQTWTATCKCGADSGELSDDDAHAWKYRHSALPGRMHSVTVVKSDGFQFSDTWEWDLRDWSYQFLWCCHAIQWGIGQYDKRPLSWRQRRRARKASASA